MTALDAAALHPDLRQTVSGRHYFAEAARLRMAVTQALVRDLDTAAFTPYLLQNTTSGLMAVLWAAARAGQEVRPGGPAEQHYPPYAAILPRGGPEAPWEFRTHVSPTTGGVDPLTDGVGLIVDAAQSLGTTLTPALLSRADVFAAPMHKHLGLCVGAGVVMVRRDMTAVDWLHDVLRIAESSAQSIDLLRRLSTEIVNARGRIFNRAQIIIDADLRNWCARYGLRLLGSGSGVPFACMTTVDGRAIDERMSLRGWRHFAASNTARFAVNERGWSTDTPLDRTDAFRSAVRAAVVDRTAGA